MYVLVCVMCSVERVCYTYIYNNSARCGAPNQVTILLFEIQSNRRAEAGVYELSVRGVCVCVYVRFTVQYYEGKLYGSVYLYVWIPDLYVI